MGTIKYKPNYKDTPEFKASYSDFKKRNKIREDDESEYHLFACIYGMEKLKEINPYYAYRYNKKDDKQVEMV
jgi:hypothetical protein